MMIYKVLMCGNRFRRFIDGSPSSVGFYVTRFVDAANPDAAGSSAVEIISAHLHADRAFTERSSVNIDSIEAAPENKMPPIQPGFAWFHEDD